MSTLKTTNIQHPDAVSPAIELDPVDGVVFSAASFDADVITSGVLDAARVPLPAGIGPNVVNVTVNGTPDLSTSTLTDVTGFTLTITPSSETSKILLVAHVSVSLNNGNGGAPQGHLALFRGTTNLYSPNSPGNRTPAGAIVNASQVQNVVLSVYDSPATTSPVTYTLRAKSASSGGTNGTIRFNRSIFETDAALWSRHVSSMTAIEVAG